MREATISAPLVAEASGASYRQIDYWSRVGALVPAVDAKGSGSQRRYTLQQAYAARVLFVLSALGAGNNVWRRVAMWLDSTLDDELSGLVIVTIGGAVVPVPPAVDLVQGWLIDLDSARRYVDDGIEAAQQYRYRPRRPIAV